MFGGKKLCKIVQNYISKTQSIIQSFMLADSVSQKGIKQKIEGKLECMDII